MKCFFDESDKNGACCRRTIKLEGTFDSWWATLIFLDSNIFSVCNNIPLIYKIWSSLVCHVSDLLYVYMSLAFAKVDSWSLTLTLTISYFWSISPYLSSTLIDADRGDRLHTTSRRIFFLLPTFAAGVECIATQRLCTKRAWSSPCTWCLIYVLFFSLSHLCPSFNM